MEKILIKLILLILLTTGVFAQQNDSWVQTDTLVAGTDTLVIDTCKSYTKYAILTVSDTGSTYTDSVFVEVYDRKLASWVRLAVRDLSDYTDDVAAIPGAGSIKSFLILYPAFSQGSIIRQRKGNATYVAGTRTLTSLRFVNNW